MPDGFSLSAGTGLGGGAWSVPVAAIGGPALIAPAGWTGDLVLGFSITSTEAAVLDGLTLVNVGGVQLAIGTRSVSVTLTDATGEAATDPTSVIVSASMIAGDGTDQTLQGSNGADVIVGSSGNETLRGLAGNDLFLIETGGGADIVQGGGGFDTLMLKGVTGGPVTDRVVAGDWTLVLDSEDPGLVQGDASLVFSEAASGRIVFGDCSEVEFSQLERITW